MKDNFEEKNNEENWIDILMKLEIMEEKLGLKKEE